MRPGKPLRRVSILRRRTRPVPLRLVGSGIRPDQRLAVQIRDQGHCVRCGAWLANIPASIHHRLPRGRGGTDRLSNLVTCCGDGVRGCHGDLESDRSQAYDDGFLLHTGNEGDNPEAVPVLTWIGWRHYLDNGEVLTRDEYRGVSGGVA